MAAKDPKPLPPFSQKYIDRFWSKVDKTPGHGPNGDCWKWTDCTIRGYGAFSVAVGPRQHRGVRANRVAYFLATGEDPYPLNVCHTCDWPLCCNPAHLFKGTTQDNTADKCAKGRGASGEKHGRYTMPHRTARGDRNGKRTHPELIPHGEEVHNALLTDEKVRLIRELRKKGWTQVNLANHFCVSRRTVRAIEYGKTWKHVT